MECCLKSEGSRTKATKRLIMKMSRARIATGRYSAVQPQLLYRSMYGTKVGLSQDGCNRVLFLLLPNVNHVPTFRPSEFVVPCAIIVGISYVGSLLYVLSTASLDSHTIKINFNQIIFPNRSNFVLFKARRFTLANLLRGLIGGLFCCLQAASLARCLAVAGISSSSFRSLATSSRSSSIFSNHRRFSSAVRQQNSSHLSRTQLYTFRQFLTVTPDWRSDRQD